MTKKRDPEFDPSLWSEIQGKKVFLPDRAVDAYSWIFEAEKEVDRYYAEEREIQSKRGEVSTEGESKMEAPTGIAAIEEGSWSPWYDIDDEKAKDALPHTPGVYEVRSDFEVNRLRGSSNVVTIGSAGPNLWQRLRQQRFHKTARGRYLNRAEKWLLHAGHHLQFRYLPTDTMEQARHLEAVELIRYEYEHWELPPGNENLPLSKVISRIQTSHNERSAKEMIKDLLRQHLSPDEIATLLSIPKEIIYSLIVYWG